MKLREDSRLCQQYINGTLSTDWDLERVAEMCCQMHRLYNYTDYPVRLKRALDDAKEFCMDLKGGYYFPTLSDETEPLVRKKVIKKNGGLPEMWPWQ